MRSRAAPGITIAIAAVTALGLSCPTSPAAQPQLTLITRSGDPFPGRPDTVFDPTLPFIGAKSHDPNGDIFFFARGRTPQSQIVSDILVYRRASNSLEPYVRTGDTIDGSPLTVQWGAVGGQQAGTISLVGSLSGSQAVLVARPDGTRSVMARNGQQPPGYAPPAQLTDVGLASGAFLDVNINRAGDVAFGAKFRDSANVQRSGYYLTRADGTQERIVDSTMRVPNHPLGQWTSYDFIGAPFDIYVPGLDAQGNAYFKAKFRQGTQDYRAFYKRTSDGTLTPLIDTSTPNAVPGHAGFSFGRLPASVNNQAGDAAFSAEILRPDSTSFGTGVYKAAPGGALTKLLDTSDPVPGIPEARDHRPGLMAMSDAGHVLVTVNYFLTFPEGNLGGQSLILFNPDGTATPVLKFDQTPGFPAQRAGLCGSADINTRGDVLFITQMNTTLPASAAFAYLNDIDELVPIIKTGDTLLGQTVVSFLFGGGATEPLGSIGASAGPVCWDDQRRLTLDVILRDATGAESHALYAVTVPSPAGLGLLGAVPLAAARRTRR
jgi:hypothetical protein